MALRYVVGMKIEVRPRQHPRYKFEVIVPKRYFGCRQRLPFKTKTAALDKQRELENKYHGSKLAPLNPGHHLCAARYQNLLTEAQMEDALAKAAGQAAYATTTFAELAESYKTHTQKRVKRGNIGEATLRDVRLRVPRLVEWMGDTPALGISKKDVENFVELLVDDGYAPKTIKNFIGRLSHLMNFGIEEGCVATNPCSKVELPKDNAKVTIITPEQLKKLIETAASGEGVGINGHRQPEGDYSLALAWIMFGAFGGSRTSETKRLEWDDIRLEDDELYVSPGKTDNAERWVTIAPPLKHYLEQLMATPRTGLVLMGRMDSNLQKFNDRLQEAAGVNIPQNALRHSFGSHHLVEHAKPQLTASQMGHYSPQMTFDAYRRAVSRKQAGRYWDLRASL